MVVVLEGKINFAYKNSKFTVAVLNIWKKGYICLFTKDVMYFLAIIAYYVIENNKVYMYELSCKFSSDATQH